MEPPEAKAGAPAGDSLVPQRLDLELAPGIAAVGRIEGGSARLGLSPGSSKKASSWKRSRLLGRSWSPGGSRGRASLVTRTRAWIPDPNRKAGVSLSEALFHQQLLDIVSPAFHEGQRCKRAPHVSAAVSVHHSAVGEVPGVTSWAVIAGRVVALKSDRQRSFSSSSQEGSGGFT